MSELWDVYDINRNKTGKTATRGLNQLKECEYHIVVEGITINSKGEILISKRAEHKKYGLMWECNGGSVIDGEALNRIRGILKDDKNGNPMYHYARRKLDEIGICAII